MIERISTSLSEPFEKKSNIILGSLISNSEQFALFGKYNNGIVYDAQVTFVKSVRRMHSKEAEGSRTEWKVIVISL